MAHPPPLLSSPPTSVALIQAEHPQRRFSVLNPAQSLRSTPGISAATLHGEIGRRPLREIEGDLGTRIVRGHEYVTFLLSAPACVYINALGAQKHDSRKQKMVWRSDQPCRFYMIDGSCKYGSDCWFSHGLDSFGRIEIQIRVAPPAYNPNVMDFNSETRIYITFSAQSREICTESKVHSYFSNFGSVVSVTIPHGRSYGFVRFMLPGTVRLLLSNWNPEVPHFISGARLHVDRYIPYYLWWPIPYSVNITSLYSLRTLLRIMGRMAWMEGQDMYQMPWVECQDKNQFRNKGLFLQLQTLNAQVWKCCKYRNPAGNGVAGQVPGVPDEVPGVPDGGAAQQDM
ncbi:Putative zinc finger CCCH domain-containing protein 51 [Triticum urartu]|uniref:Putative zinc finger CCCH domain-containing protein 51 n=1 Tax=Triticum urartu TaxID=4572 RepID=M7YN83_TRIUA|nr:Putative zinc finger CCCH domain-containing protein 51 [Triticum urartu]